MNDQILEEAERLFEQAKPVQAISEYQREQQAIRSNFERLKAERLARERITTPLDLSLEHIDLTHR